MSLTAVFAASVLLCLGTDGPPTVLRVGQSVTGRLAQDVRDSPMARCTGSTASPDKGDTVAFDLTSDAFDANLLIADGSGKTLAQNDDGGGRCNARLTFVAPASASYRLYANSSARAELGDYRLSVARGSAPAPADTVCKGFGRVAGMIDVGQTISGTLTSDDPAFSGDSTYFQRWIPGQGEPPCVDPSRATSTYVLLAGAGATSSSRAMTAIEHAMHRLRRGTIIRSASS
jgi:hypothetical protein